MANWLFDPDGLEECTDRQTGRGVAYPPNLYPELEPWLEWVRVQLEDLNDAVAISAGQILSMSLSIDTTTGEVDLLIYPGLDTAAVAYLASTSGYPSLSDIDTTGTHVVIADGSEGQPISASAIVTLEEGETAYVGAIAYEGNDGTVGTGCASVPAYEAIDFPCPCEVECPNLAPSDGATAHRTAEAAGTVDGYTYELVNLAAVGIEPSTDTISYCYNAKVGPGDYEEIFCEGMFALRESGILTLTDPLTPSHFNAAGDVTGVVKDGIDAIEIRDDRPLVHSGVESGASTFAYATLVDSRLGFNADGTINASLPKRTKIHLQAKYHYEGTLSPRIGGAGRDITTGVTGHTWDQQHNGTRWGEYYMTSPFFGVFTDPEGEKSVNSGWMYLVTRYEGLFAGRSSNALIEIAGGYAGRVNIGNVISGNRRETEPQSAVHFTVENDGKIWASVVRPPLRVVADKNPILAKSSTYVGSDLYPVVGLLQSTPANSLRPCLPDDAIEVGRGWWWDIGAYKDKKTVVQAVGTEGFAGNRWIAVEDYNGFHGYAPNDDVDEHVWWNWQDNLDIWYTDPAEITLRTDSTDPVPEWKIDAPGTKFEVWDGPPWESGSSLIEECLVGRGIYPGDQWDYSSESDLSQGDTLDDVYVALLMDFLDDEKSVISTVSPTPVNTLEYTRVESLNNSIPADARYLQFRVQKTGVDVGWGEIDDLQVNPGAVCCPYTTPISALLSLDSTGNLELGSIGIHEGDLVTDSDSGTDDPHIGRLWSAEDDRYVTADEIVDGFEEHLQGATNLLRESQAERSTSSAAGTQDANPYPLIDLDQQGIDEGDKVSVRAEGKVET